MAGVKGRSGRKSMFKEAEDYKIRCYAAGTLKQFFEHPDVSLERKAVIAASIHIKYITEKHEDRLTLIPYKDTQVLSKYETLPAPQLELITGNTSSPIDINPTISNS